MNTTPKPSADNETTPPPLDTDTPPHRGETAPTTDDIRGAATSSARDASRTGVYEHELAGVREVAVDIARAAEEIHGVSARLTAVLSHSGLAASVTRSPRTGMAAQRALVRAAVHSNGLGFALTGGRLVNVPEKLGTLTGRERLASLVAVASLRLRIAAATRTHPELLENEGVRRLVEAITSDRSIQAMRELRRLAKDDDVSRALNDIAPIFTELLALNALLDEDPFNDESGWAIASGRPIRHEPLLGVTVNAVCRWDVGRGTAEPVDLTRQEDEEISTEGTITGMMRNIAVLKNTGRAYLQEVHGADGILRYILYAPGMQGGMPRNDSPQDLVGAWRNTLMDESPYTRALVCAVEAFGVPEGAEIALMGHSEGGAAVMNLAQDPDVHSRYTITHVIAVGAPVDFKRPPKTAFVATITNQHDLIPCLDGQGPGSPFHLHPDWYVVDYQDDTHRFPACHHALKYLANLENDLHEAREHIDSALAPYQGQVSRAQAYQLFDEIRPPAGFPFLAVPTTPRQISTGTVETPVRCFDGTAATLLFAVPAAAAAQALAGTGLAPVTVRGRAVAAVMVRALHDTSVGPHNEVALAVLVQDPWRPGSLRCWPDLLKPADRRRSGLHVLDLAVDQELPRAVADEVWGFPAFAAQVTATFGKGRLTAAIRRDGQTLLTLAGRLGPWAPAPATDLVCYSLQEGQGLRSLVNAHGLQRAHPASNLRLTATPGHPMTDRVHALGLDRARPILALVAPSYQARLDESLPVHIPR
ncbi:acetoacetate decarboxylase family protein [Actinomadura fulvescens]|uniref:Uncharacterized protein n=1 Tax=Actinomadura fulvescens TaxID=46160 RepID=A0ABP6CP31_9ACTN